MDDQPIEEVPQNLITCRLVIRMVLIAEQGVEFGLAHLEIHQREDLDDVGIAELQGHTEFLEDVVVGHV